MTTPNSAKEIREAFFEFFRTKGHKIVPSAPMVVKNDPTLMFTNAGMNQFKDIFLGNRNPSDLRVANTQKCLRVSGKHNDLEEVGHDTYHHTMFEMLGNWSFGDYFKKEAIEWAWEFLTQVVQLPQERLYATIFEGDKSDSIPRDEEAMKYWKKCFGEEKNRILDGSKDDNFWEMGDTGPCGPCSEIHIDLRDDSERNALPGHELVNSGHPLVVEIWNLVFIQYNRKADGTLEQLPAKHVDTGMGFERLCMAVQNKKSNYDTDIFSVIIGKISEIAGIRYGESEESDIAMRVIADHLRAVSFSIADGQIPSNNKAGYVIRRILRRAVRYGYKNLGMEEPFIYRLVDLLAEVMGNSFPELSNGKEQIARVILDEEQGFLRTLGKGERRLEREIELMREKGVKSLSGIIAFEMYDTYGFPLDLTELILREEKLVVDSEEFEKAMESQRNRSKESASVDTGDWVVVNESGETLFTGYETTSEEIKIARYRKVKQKGKEFYHLVFDKTPFYAEAGGQAGDTGYLESNSEKVAILNTIKENELIVHITKELPGNTNDLFMAVADSRKRELTENNHSATHLLHHALREQLGSHVEQKGSYVDHERLRFDFTHSSKITAKEISLIEQNVNSMIRKNIGRETHSDISMEEAGKMGAIALFGEKYGDSVRVVGFGPSIELCGGTHVDNTGRIGLFKIVTESAIAAGVRRIEAFTGDKALTWVNEKMEQLDNVAGILQSTGDVAAAAEKVVTENSLLRKSIEKLQSTIAAGTAENLKNSAVNIGGGILFSGSNTGAMGGDMHKLVAGIMRNSPEKRVVVLGASSGGKVTLTVMVSDALAAEGKIDAVALLREIAPEIGGKGGGQPFLAVAGGNNPDGTDKAIAKALKTAKERVK